MLWLPLVAYLTSVPAVTDAPQHFESAVSGSQHEGRPHPRGHAVNTRAHPQHLEHLRLQVMYVTPQLNKPVATDDEASRKGLWLTLANQEVARQLRTCTSEFVQWVGGVDKPSLPAED